MNRAILVTLVGLLLCGAATAAPDDKQSEEFRRACGEQAAAANAANEMTVVGQDGWMFLASELRHLSVGEFTGEAAQTASKATNPEWRDPLPAILDFKAGLERAGIELLVVPVPPKAIIYPEFLAGEPPADAGTTPPRLDLVHQRFYSLLQEHGVNVLDLYPAFTAARRDGAGLVYCKQDSHWSGRGCQIAAKEIVASIKSREWLDSVNKQTPASEVRDWEIDGDLRTAAKGVTPPKERLQLRFVGTGEGGVLQPIAPDPSSPAIVLGDSHTLIFHAGEDMHARGAGLADQLALELGFAPDLIGVRGSGATPARINLYRRASGDANYLRNKKLVVWCFTARDFTEAASGWRKVPVPK